MLDHKSALSKDSRIRLMLVAILLALAMIVTFAVSSAYADADEDTEAEEVEIALAEEDQKEEAAPADEASKKEEAASTSDASKKDEAASADDASKKDDAADDKADSSADKPAANTPKDTFLMGNDLMWFGREITITAYSSADDIIGAGETITLNESKAESSVRLAGRIITLNDTVAGGTITIAGQDVVIKGGSSNAAAMAGAYADFSGTTGELWIAADEVKIDGVVTGDVHVEANSIRIGENARIEGTLKGEVGSEPDIDATAEIGSNELVVKAMDTEESSDITSKLDWKVILFSVLNCLFVSLLAEWLASGHTAGAATLLKSSVGGYLGATVIGAIILPIAIVLLCVPIVTIPAAIAALLVVFAIALVSNGFTAAALGRLILPNVGRYKTAILMGILVGLLCAMPYVGGPVRLICYLFMLGYAVRSLRVGMLQRREERDAEVIQF